MKKVVLAPAVEIAMRTLDPDGVRRVHAWFSYLERWDTDEVVRRNSEQLQEMPGVYVMRTTTDIRIFFRIDGDTVTVLDVAKKAAILTSGHIAGVS
jgi:mRNA-degrading endonuclease RelE of RelBE toxin-antitoxin system